jgi:hypothetical protein
MRIEEEFWILLTCQRLRAPILSYFEKANLLSSTELYKCQNVILQLNSAQYIAIELLL